MKNIKYIFALIIITPVFIMSCSKEEIKKPGVYDVEMYMNNSEEKDSLITNIYAGEEIKIVVETDADVISIWPGGVRTVEKKTNSTVDSLDWNGSPVLIESDCYSDYGLVGANGYKTSLMEEEDTDVARWYTYYTYPSSGEYTLTVVATNYGYDSFGLIRTISEITVTVN